VGSIDDGRLRGWVDYTVVVDARTDELQIGGQEKHALRQATSTTDSQSSVVSTVISRKSNCGPSSGGKC
jgi:thymidine phosphorylase